MFTIIEKVSYLCKNINVNYFNGKLSDEKNKQKKIIWN